MTSKPDSMETRLVDDPRPTDEPARTETRSQPTEDLEERQRAEYLRLLRLV
jgi:hypothetical protein